MVVVGVAERRVYGTFRYSTVRIAQQMQNVNTIRTVDATLGQTWGTQGRGNLEHVATFNHLVRPYLHARPCSRPAHALAAHTLLWATSCGVPTHPGRGGRAVKDGRGRKGAVGERMGRGKRNNERI